MLLEVDNLTVDFGRLRALDRLSLGVKEGRIHSVIGPNGAGKTTFFNAVTGRLRPKAGKIRFEDRSLVGKSPHVIARMGLARSFQITNIFLDLTVRENLCVAAQAADQRGRSVLWPARRLSRVDARAEELLGRLGLASVADRPAREISHGHKRHLEIGMTLATRPRLLLLDEPTSGLSPFEAEETMELIKNLSEEVTILLIEHNIHLVFTLSDTIVVIHYGKKIAEGPPDSISQNMEVQTVYLGEL